MLYTRVHDGLKCTIFASQRHRGCSSVAAPKHDIVSVHDRPRGGMTDTEGDSRAVCRHRRTHADIRC